MRLIIASAGLAALMASAAALAGETINYKYDARGRLLKVERTGTVNAGVTSNYTFDRANNRVNVTVAGAATSALASNASEPQLSSDVLEAEQPSAISEEGFADEEVRSPFFWVDDPSAAEGGDLVFAVTKGGSSSETLTVNYATSAGTADLDDYLSQSGSLTFAPHERVKHVAVPVAADAGAEPDETLVLSISGAVPISDAQGVGTIVAHGEQ